MPGEVNCIFTKALIPFVEDRVGADGVAAIVRTAGLSRDYLIADHNWIPLTLANTLVHFSMQLMGEPDETRWARAYSEAFMDWKPSRQERSYIGTYTMGIGEPRGVYERFPVVYRAAWRHARIDMLGIGRHRARFEVTPLAGQTMPTWSCQWVHVALRRFPTNWGLPPATVTEPTCATRGDAACVFDVRWKNPSLGASFWAATGAGAAVSAAVALSIGAGASPPAAWVASTLPVVTGASVGLAVREWQRRRHTRRLLDLQSDEIIFSNQALESKFRDLETRIAELSLLTELSASVIATLEPEKIYEQALSSLVRRPGYQSAYFFLADRAQGVVRGHKVAASDARAGGLPERLEFPLDTRHSIVGKVAVTGLPIIATDIAVTDEPLARPEAERLGYRGLLAVPLRVEDEVIGVLAVSAFEANVLGQGDLELVSAVANHVALALDRAQSFHTIEGLTRGLEDKVRVRTEELRAANEALGSRNEELTRALARQTATSEVSKIISRSATDAQPVFTAIVEHAGELCESDMGVLFRWDGDAFHAIARRIPDPVFDRLFDAPRRPGQNSGLGRLARDRRTLHIHDIRDAPGYRDREAISVQSVEIAGARTWLGVPLLKDEQLIGAIVVYRKDVWPFSDEQIALLETFADQAVIAMENARLFTELQAAYRDLQATQVQLVQREKMASVGQLVAGVAHELNNPIGFVSSNVVTLEDFVGRVRALLETYDAAALPEDERARVAERRKALKVDYALKYLDSMIQGIREGADRARKIVRDLRVFARTEDDVWQPVDLHEDIESSLTLLGHVMKEQITVHRRFGALPPVDCVRSQIDQVFLNLLANAAQAINGRGEITLETAQEDDMAVVRITDSGPGIPPEVMGRIFDPFFTTKTVGEGTGLGLSISYEIMKKHRGEITAASPPGAGATFTVRLPIARRV